MRRFEPSIITPHSTSDWDFYKVVAGSWELDPTLFLSPPSSLRLQVPATPGPWWYAMMICNLPATLNLKEGRIITYCRDFAYTLHAYYRRGFITGFKDISNFSTDGAYFTVANFVKSRLTWWNSYDLHNNPKLAYRRDDYYDDVWHEGTISYRDRLEGDINRVGLFAATSYWGPGGIDARFDDTEIWI